MRNASKNIIIIPAYNEAEHIGKTIDLIHQSGIKTEIIVVDDGSTDKTAEIAKNKGCTVIKLKKNFGKANAFYAGVKEALKRGANAVVSLDADMVEIPKYTLAEMFDRAAEETAKKRIKMIVAPVFERELPASTISVSGMRAFSLPALYKLMSTKFKRIPKGYGLELFLNKFFEKSTQKLEKSTPFKAEKCGRDGRVIDQLQHSAITTRRIWKRIRPR